MAGSKEELFRVRRSAGERSVSKIMRVGKLLIFKLIYFLQNDLLSAVHWMRDNRRFPALLIKDGLQFGVRINVVARYDI
jgi:hypothetical protein